MLLSPTPYKNKTIREVGMATWTNVCSPYGMACIKCDHLLIAPKWSAYATKHEVRHFWSCDNCGHEIEIVVDLRVDATSEYDKSLESVVA
jgi:RNase P subunit RPR2